MAKKEPTKPIRRFPDHNCTRCELFNTTSNVCVGFYGNTQSDIVVIGEAPGEAEERTGKPFQGRSGQLLTKLLEEIGIDREDIYVTNSVLCRPPDNRAPKNSELKACLPYLNHQLETTKPKYVLLLGSTALKQVLGKTGITELHGSVFEKGGIKYLPTFHPAAALRDTKRLTPLRLDIAKFGRLISDSIEEKPKLNVRVITEPSPELLEELKKSRVIVFDIETTSLDRFGTDDRINYIGVGTLRTQWELKLPLWGGDPKPFLLAIKEVCEGKEIVMHNGKFDNLWMEYHYGVKYFISFDTIIAAQLLDENSALSLKYLAKVHCGGHDYDLADKAKTRLGPETEEYLGYDLLYTRRLYHYLKSELQKDEALWSLFNTLSMPAVRAYETIEANGVYINTNKFEEVREELTRERSKRLRKLTRQADINWNSPDQVADVFYSQLGLPILNKTPGGKPSTDEATLLSLAQDYRIAQDLLDFRETDKLMSTYVEGWQKRLKKGNWLFPSFKTTGAVTGRPSCSDPNLQQTPRNKIIRSLVDAPDGWEVFEADYCLTGDTEILTVEGPKPISSLVNNPLPVLSLDSETLKQIGVLKNRKLPALQFQAVTKAARVGVAPILKIMFEDGSYVKCTPEHKFRDLLGEFKEAKYLSVGDRLSHVYTTWMGKERAYPTWSFQGFQRPCHEVVAEFSIGPKPPGYQVDHVDSDTKNWSRENLRYLSESDNRSQGGKRYWESIRLNGRDDSKRLSKLRESMFRRRSYIGEGNPNFGNKKGLYSPCRLCSQPVYSHPGRKKPKQFCNREHYSLWKSRNHRIVKILKLPQEPVYQITVEKNHNYILANGLISANSQVELRITAQVSQDPALLHAYTHGIDVHTLTASEVMGVLLDQVNENQRKMAKAVNFGLIYGMKPPKFKRYCFEKYGIKITDRESVQFCDRFFAKYDLRRWHERQIRLVRVAGQVRTLTGRIRHLPDIFSPDRMLSSQAERQSINSPVQGFAAELTLMAICEILDTFPTSDLRLFGTVHDATLGRYRKRLKRIILPKIKSIMEHPKILDILGIELDIPLEVDIKCGPWGAGKKFEL